MALDLTIIILIMMIIKLVTYNKSNMNKYNTRNNNKQ